MLNEEKRRASQRKAGEARQDMQWILAQLVEQQRSSEEILNAFHKLSEELQVLIARLGERCPRHDYELGRIQEELVRYEEDTKARMVRQGERLTALENDRQRAFGFFIAVGALCTFLSGLFGAWVSKKF